MDPVLASILNSWELRPLILILFVLLLLLYTRGWVALRKRSRDNKLATTWRLAFYWLGIFLTFIALMSPIDVLGGMLFALHMIQHLLLTMFSAPLIMLANPMPFILWGLPRPQRRLVGGWLSRILHRESTFRTRLRQLTAPGICWGLMVAFLWGWHDPQMYNSALRSDFVHDLEHFTFFFTAMLYWWHATGSAPRIHKLMPRPARVMYLLLGIPANMAPGIVISFAENILYTYYETVPRIPGALNLAVLDDQIIGGIIMWVPGSMMFIIAALVVIARWLQDEERKKIAREKYWQSIPASTKEHGLEAK